MPHSQENDQTINLSAGPLHRLESQYEASIQFGCETSTIDTVNQLATASNLSMTEVARRIFLAALKDANLVATALESDEEKRVDQQSGHGPHQHPGRRVIETIQSAITDAIARNPGLTHPESREQLLDVIAHSPIVAPLMERGLVTPEELAQWTAERLSGQPPLSELPPNVREIE